MTITASNLDLTALRANATKAGKVRVLEYTDSTGTPYASGQDYCPLFAVQLAQLLGRPIVGGATFRCGASNNPWESRQFPGTYWKSNSGSVTFEEASSAGATDAQTIPLGGKMAKMPSNATLAPAYIFPNLKFEQTTAGASATTDFINAASNQVEIPAPIRGVQVVPDLTGKTIRIRAFLRPRADGTPSVQWRAHERAASPTWWTQIAVAGAQAVPGLTGSGGCVVAEWTFTATAACNDGMYVWIQAGTVAPLDCYGYEWSIDGEDGLIITYLAAGSRQARHVAGTDGVSGESGQSGAVIAAFSPDIVCLRYGPNDADGSGAGTTTNYTTGIVGARTFLTAHVPGASACVVDAPYTPFGASNDNRIASMEAMPAAIAALAEAHGFIHLDSKARGKLAGVSVQNYARLTTTFAGLSGNYFDNNDGVHSRINFGADGAEYIGQLAFIGAEITALGTALAIAPPSAAENAGAVRSELAGELAMIAELHDNRLTAPRAAALDNILAASSSMLGWLYRRFRNRTVHDRDAGTIVTFADDGTTPLTTQTATDNGTQQEVGPAS